ncbi:hypothetical protein K3N28_13855 [Glycomyces sp. TRM65418]|uniref:hypothetical protein n=1 Tax=Glycomyces sp. TRM65418 TaxID=2867006 RepID=UPI001CE4BAFF|nr:hypothetical protein [Glycomyces sp. TRM65418]MCC3764148.1 hypothetical protein [Glycomyces sp. TRM65418]QZD53833.1 hypothetical protein K3N28_13790 [Glycomyces sp. TRM65418]
MLAHEYGYRVSADCALAADGTQAAAHASEERAKAGTRTMLRWNGTAFAFAALSLVLTFVVSVRFAPLIALAVLLWCGVFLNDAVRSKREPSIAKLIVFPLSAEPWQAWPCRVADARGKANSPTKLVYLMSPDQEVVRAFKTRIPEEVGSRMAHGMGVLWVCGDLESPPMPGTDGVAMASVGGEVVWGARHASQRQTRDGPPPAPAFSRIVEEASSAEMGKRLNP